MREREREREKERERKRERERERESGERRGNNGEIEERQKYKGTRERR